MNSLSITRWFRERLLHEIAVRKQAFYQTRVRRVSLGNIRKVVRSSRRRRRSHCRRMDVKGGGESYQELLEQVDVLSEWCLYIHDEFPNIEQYFAMKIAKARQYGC